MPRRLATPWRRLGAFLLDCLALGIVASVFGSIFFDQLAGLGFWCRFIGLLVAVLYFGVLESTLFGGQSLGKVMLGLQVVKRDGGKLSVEDAVLRTLLVWLPISLNTLPLPLSRTPSAVYWLLGLVIFGLGGATLYLILFNRQTRQGVHDLAAGSYVVHADDNGAVEAPPILRKHRLILAGLLLVVVFASGVASRIEGVGRFPEVLRDVALVEAMPGVQQGGAFFGIAKTFHDGETHTTQYLTVTARLRTRPHDQGELASAIARNILENDPRSAQDDVLNVDLVMGYDLGFWSSYRSQRYSRSPAAWREYLGMPQHQGL